MTESTKNTGEQPNAELPVTAAETDGAVPAKKPRRPRTAKPKAAADADATVQAVSDAVAVTATEAPDHAEKTAEPSAEAASPAADVSENQRGDGSQRKRDRQPRREGGGMREKGGDAQGAQRRGENRPGPRNAQRAAGDEEGYQFADIVSGQLDRDEDDEAVAPTKRVLPPQAETPKLHKVLAQAGVGSRLEMEQLILEGRISVNNEPAHIGQRVQFGDQVKINGKPIRFRIEPPPVRVLAYHKPVGEVVTHDDPQNRPTVFRKLPRLVQGKWQSVGRLDLNTEGLLLFTSSGELANKLMHPRFGLEREYAVRVLGALTPDEKERLLSGVQLEDGMASFGSIDDGGGEGVNQWYRVTISEGRNREVRRMFEAVGHAVSRLIRIRYGAMMLPRGLKRGSFLELDERDIRALVQAAGAGGLIDTRAQDQGGGRSGQRRDSRPRNSGPRGAMGNGGNTSPRSGGNRGSGQNASSGQRGRGRPAGGGGSGGGSQPDPMKTSVGYIGGDSFSRQRQQQRNSGGRRRDR
ncbi:pseudouridine synthase [Diaphorobacter ruginosibacter]|uniref:Pseudouridine synthase n=1 Tax=Diaphorobacter ruginosibacter TaxID=1715720 RepID=A0A7G9RKS2_9BURK|nr:pseudouridine synthase [Diaphorobacter ruginosibacter]QNN56197.1 pseudouridine synthase [Diaphorobacter ruginosibacter]